MTERQRIVLLCSFFEFALSGRFAWRLSLAQALWNCRKMQKAKEKAAVEEQKFHRRSQQWVGAALFIVASYFVITGGYHNLDFLGGGMVGDAEFDADDEME